MEGVIAAGGPATVAAGTEMLRRGGNAVDAAVAAAFASFVAEIGVVHLGGSGIAQIWDPVREEAIVYDFFSTVPGLGRTDPAEMDFQRVTIDFGATTQDFHLGRASVAVPGNIAGLCRLAGDHGRLPLAVLLEPALRLAREGATLDTFQAETCLLLKPLYTHTAGMRHIFMPDGKMVGAGRRLFIPHLAETYEALAAEGAEMARTGRLARAFLTDQQANGGLLTADDLTSYQVYRQRPIPLPYRDYEVLLPPPSSTGGVLVAFSLRLLAAHEISRWPAGSAPYLRLLYEIMAATNRARPLFDDACATREIPDAVAYFLSDEVVEPFQEQVRAGLRGEPWPIQPEPRGAGNTSHLSVVDGEGLAVSLTTTAGESAGYVVPGTGFIPNNMLGEADLHPSGFHTRPAGERIPTMMTPTVVRHNGNVRLVLGTGGSERIRSAILQVLTNLLDYGMTLDQAVNRPRVHLERDVLQCEAGYDPDAVGQLEAWGYPANRWPTRSIYFGGAHSVSRTPSGRLVAAGDNRRGGSTGRV